MLVAGDVGGTKTDLAVYSGTSSLKSPVARKQFHSADYGSLHAIVAEFLAGVRIPVSHGVFGVPGPVINGSVATSLIGMARRRANGCCGETATQTRW